MASNPAPTRRQKLEAREQAIVLAARDELLEHGFGGAKMAAIARRADVAEGTLYLYFKNKKALKAAVVGEFYGRLTETAQQGVSQRAGTQERLEFLARHHLNSCLAEWGVLELAAAESRLVSGYRKSEFISFNRSYVAVFDHVIREAIHRGDVRDDVPLHVMRDLFYGALEYAVRTHLIHQHAVDDEEEISRTTAHLMSMVAPAFGLKPRLDASSAEADTHLEAVTRRLEAIAARLET